MTGPNECKKDYWNGMFIALANDALNSMANGMSVRLSQYQGEANNFFFLFFFFFFLILWYKVLNISLDSLASERIKTDIEFDFNFWPANTTFWKSDRMIQAKP